MVTRGFVVAGIEARSGRRFRLAATRDDGRSFADLGLAGTGSLDAVDFLDQHHGWAVARSSDVTLAETLWRTDDGGSSWQQFAAPEHNEAAGSRDSVQFVTRQVGWLARYDVNGPVEELYRTHDGGRSWRRVASLRNDTLPVIGSFRFASRSVGYLAGYGYAYAPLRRALYRSQDGGRAWEPLPVPQGRPGVPAVVNRALVLASETRRATIIYRGRDGGATWRRLGRLPSQNPTGMCTDPSVAFAGAGAGWAATITHHRLSVYRSADLRAWRRTTAPPLHDQCPPTVAALDARRAWLIGDDGAAYVSTNAGRQWHRVQPGDLSGH